LRGSACNHGKEESIARGLAYRLAPALRYWYVDQDHGRFIKTLIIGIAAIAAMIMLDCAVLYTARQRA